MTGMQAFTRERDPLLVRNTRLAKHANSRYLLRLLITSPIAYYKSDCLLQVACSDCLLLILIELDAEVRQQHLRRRGDHAPPQHRRPHHEYLPSFSFQVP